MSVIAVMRAEWYRSTHSWRFWATAVVALLLFLLAIYQSSSPWTHEVIPRFNNFFSVSLMYLGNYVDALWPIFIPLLAVLPNGDGLAVDRLRGADCLAITRVGWAGYLWGKVTGDALSATAAVGLAMAAAAALAAVTYPLALPHFLQWRFNANLPHKVRLSGTFGDAYPILYSRHLFWAAPIDDLALAYAIALWAVAALSALSTAAAAWVRAPILTLSVPLVLFLALTVAAEGAFTSQLVPPVYAGAYLDFYSLAGSWGGLALYWAVPAAFSAAVLAWLARRGEWPTRGLGL